MTATTLVNFSYLMIPASVVQMTRGAVVLFTCLFSLVFLGRKQFRYHYLGVFLVCAGITLVASCCGKKSESQRKLAHLGITLCVLAQAFQASMLVIEEKVLSKYTVAPMLAVGLEGLFGCAILAVVIFVSGGGK